MLPPPSRGLVDVCLLKQKCTAAAAGKFAPFGNGLTSEQTKKENGNGRLNLQHTTWEANKNEKKDTKAVHVYSRRLLYAQWKKERLS